MHGVDLQGKSKELAMSMDRYVKNNFEELVAKFVDCFLLYCNQIYQMQQKNEKGAVAYIQFSVLRTNLLLKRHELRMDAYDENWYMDSVECSAYYPVGEIYGYLERYGEIVEELRRESGRDITLIESQKRIFAESNLYLFYVAELIRVGMRRIIQTEIYQRLDRAPCFIVCIGGYLDRFDILYKEDTTVKDSGDVKRYFQAKEQMVYRHEICENLDLSKGNYEELEFQYSSFAGCDFSESSWNRGKILFSDFRNTILKDTKMEKMKIFDTDFSGAVLENINFAGTKLKYISFVGAKLVQVDFSKALIAEEIEFQNARLINCRLPEGW